MESLRVRVDYDFASRLAGGAFGGIQEEFTMRSILSRGADRQRR
jgi:hypothetical protein